MTLKVSFVPCCFRPVCSSGPVGGARVPPSERVEEEQFEAAEEETADDKLTAADLQHGGPSGTHSPLTNPPRPRSRQQRRLPAGGDLLPVEAAASVR